VANNGFVDNNKLFSLQLRVQQDLQFRADFRVVQSKNQFSLFIHLIPFNAIYNSNNLNTAANITYN
jgi:hypothetical protein